MGRSLSTNQLRASVLASTGLPLYWTYLGSRQTSDEAAATREESIHRHDFPEQFRRMTKLADVVVIDETHHFRNPGHKGDPSSLSESSLIAQAIPACPVPSSLLGLHNEAAKNFR